MAYIQNAVSPEGVKHPKARLSVCFLPYSPSAYVLTYHSVCSWTLSKYILDFQNSTKRFEL